MKTKPCEICNGTGLMRRQIFFWGFKPCRNCDGSGREIDVVASLLDQITPDMPRELRQAALDRVRQRLGGAA